MSAIAKANLPFREAPGRQIPASNSRPAASTGRPLPLRRLLSVWHAGLILLLLTFVPPLPAALITYEGFAYVDNASLNTQTGGTGWQTGFGWAGGGSATITTPGRTFPGLANSGRSALFRAGGIQTRAFVTTGYASLRTSGRFGLDGTELWLSFLARRETNFFVGDSGGLSLMDGNTVELFVGCPAGAARWSVQLPELGTAPANITPAPNAPLVTGETTLLVVRMSFGVNGTQDRVDLFVNPAPGVIPTTPNATRTGADIRFDRLRLQSGASALSAMSFDEIRLGESFSDVVPTTPNPAIAWLRAGAQRVTAGAEITLPLQYAWPAGDLATLGLAVESADTGILPADRITVVGTGANRRVTFRPLPSERGSAAVTATLTQPGGSVVTATFDLLNLKT